jgi:hypothetical protein
MSDEDWSGRALDGETVNGDVVGLDLEVACAVTDDGFARRCSGPGVRTELGPPDGQRLIDNNRLVIGAIPALSPDQSYTLALIFQ